MQIEILIRSFLDGAYDERLLDIYADEAKISYQRERYINAIKKFEQCYKPGDVELFSAPGRSEIGGNHTDHQNGEVLAASVNLDTIGVVRKTDDNVIRLVSDNYDEIIIRLDDVSVNEKVYDIGFIFSDYMAEEATKTERKYLEDLRRYICDNTQKNIVMLVGRKVSDISKIARSYGNVCMLRSFQGFRIVKSIYYYEDEVKISADGIVLCKDSLDKLLRTVEQNNHLEIRNAVAKFYDEMSSMGMNGESMNLNINYLLFQFIHLASEQDDNVNQQEILRLISESSFKTGIERGSRAHMTRFCCEYGDYLSQLRKNVSRGVIGMVEKEVRDNYATNITLKSLSEKYYVNSAYLGQLFRKKYGQSFKDYLNNYRMERAAELLLRTDKKIIQIAEEVGYHDMDYFVNRFIQVKGCTPARFRRQMQSGE